jgi:hypothetical protein
MAIGYVVEVFACVLQRFRDKWCVENGNTTEGSFLKRHLEDIVSNSGL